MPLLILVISLIVLVTMVAAAESVARDQARRHNRWP